MKPLRRSACSECHKLIVVGSTPRGGRPRKTCGWKCSLARQRRRAKEACCADAPEIAAWWLALNLGQRLAAMAYVRTNPPPPGFIGGKPDWAYYSRHAFSCEGRPVSVEGA